MTNLSQRLDLRQSQTLVMTPQLQQAIKLLQLSNLELAQFIEGELAQNPLLEKADGPEGNTEGEGETAGSDSAQAAETAAERAADDVGAEFDEAWTGNEAATGSAASDVPLPDFDPGSAGTTGGGAAGTSFDDPESSFENRMSREVSLREHLEKQLHMAFSDARDRLVGAQLIDLLDDTGYMRQDTAELSLRLGCSEERLKTILARLKTFDPTGIFAANLQECLALQLEERGQLDAPMKTLLSHLNLLAAHEMKNLAAKCGVNETYLADMVAEIRSLNPRPAADFDNLVVQTAVPDVLMKRLPKNLGGGWRVELNSETLPRVLVNNVYYAEVANKTRSKQDARYLEEQLQSASWLVKALDQRAKTILKVAGEIIERQEAFFLYGIEYLKPLTLRDIAQAIGMHESTVSRVTTNKYIGTPRGIFELKYFFSGALGEGEDAVAAEAVKARIKAMIDAENPDAVLSDDALVDILKKDGVDIARRTVAKYRESLHIPSSVQRRRAKKPR